MKYFLGLALMCFSMNGWAGLSHECTPMNVEGVCVLECVINGDGVALQILHTGQCRPTEQIDLNK